jgi:hypothetical protein
MRTIVTTATAEKSRLSVVTPTAAYVRRLVVPPYRELAAEAGDEHDAHDHPADPVVAARTSQPLRAHRAG